MKTEDVYEYFDEHENCPSEAVDVIMREAVVRARRNGTLWLLSDSKVDSQTFYGYSVSFPTFQVLESWLIDVGVLPAQFKRHTYEQGKLFVMNAPESWLCLEELAEVMSMGETRACLIAEKLERLGYIRIQNDGGFERLKKHTHEEIAELARRLAWKYNRCDTELLQRLLYLGSIPAQVMVLQVNYVPRRQRIDMSVPQKEFEAMVAAGDYSLVKDPIALKIARARYIRPKPMSSQCSIQFHPWST